MKSLEPTKHQLLENRVNDARVVCDSKMISNNSNSTNIDDKLADNLSDSIMSHGNSKTNDLQLVRDSNSNNTKTDEILLNVGFITDADIQEKIVFDARSNPFSNAPLFNSHSNLLITNVASPAKNPPMKRMKKLKNESPSIKKFCSRTEKKIDEIFKSQANCQLALSASRDIKPFSEGFPEIAFEDYFVPTLSMSVSVPYSGDPDIIPDHEIIADSAIIDTLKHANNIADSDLATLTLRRKVESLDIEVDSLRKQRDVNDDYRKKSREMLIKVLKQLCESERAATKVRVNHNKFQLGQFNKNRVGVIYEEKWYDGVKYQDLEKRKRDILKEKEENEKNKKLWNKKKQTRLRGSSEPLLNPTEAKEYFYQAEIYDIRKSSIDKEEKEMQTEMDRFDLERNLHIREIKRMNSEEASRFYDYKILNERYLILSLLGKGGFSEVHKCFDLDQLVFVACKIHELAPNWSQEKKDSYIRHALRETSIHKSLDHNRIVKVHDVFNIDNNAFCTVLEYCEGNDLDFFLKQNKYIPEREAKSIICQLVSALRYLNDRKNPIIHYDLKPGNILLNNSGEIKITDFGLSKIFPDDHHNPDGMELTSQGAGTYWYLPPECFVTENGPPTISSKVDVWSVGVIFYQCLYGRKPFGNNMTQTDILHNNTILQARSINFPANPKVSDAAKDFIRKCCTYHKEQRPDVLQLCTEEYLKPKGQPKGSVDVFVAPGPL